MADEVGSARPLVGRPETVALLHRRFEEARAGTGGVTLLVGDTGVGKSTLIADLVREIRGRGTSVLLGRALPLDDPPPFSLVRAAIESPRTDPTLRSPDAPSVGGPALIGFAPRMDDTAFPVPVTVEARLLEALGGTGEPEARARDRVLSEIAEQFLAFTRRGPTVLILEDLHRADESSLDAVEFLASELKDQPLWILATSRPYASLAESARARLEAFESATHAHPTVLRPLTSGEVAEYLRLTDPSREFSPEEVARRYSETGGNPLLLEQLDHRVAAAGEGTAAPGAVLPPLDEEAQRLLDVAAVLGPEFSFEILLRVSGEQDEERLTEAVDRLVGHGLLFERPGELLAFPEDRLREEAYHRLSESRRRILHWSAGETLEATGSGGLSTIYALARHFYLGGAGRKSVRYNRLAADIAERALAPDVARDHLSRALESQRALDPKNVEGESELVLELARITEELGHIREAERVLRDFLDRETNDARLSARRRATLEIFLARVLTDEGDMPAVAEIAKKILSTPDLDSQPLVRIGGFHHLGITLYYEGRYSEALTQHTEELRLAREVGNALVIARAQIWRVAALAMMGKTEQAIAEAREVTVARDALGSVRESAQAHLFLGDILADARSPPAQREEAIGEYANAIRFAERAQDPRRVGWATYKTSELLREAGRLDEAAEHAEKARGIFAEIGDQVGLSVSTKVRGQVAMDRGAYDRARADFLEAHRLLEGLHHNLEEIDVILRLAEAAVALGDRPSARRHVAELEHRELTTVRPDLAREFARLKEALAATGGEGDAT